MESQEIIDILETPEQAQELYNRSGDVNETEDILRGFGQLKTIRNPFYLNANELERVLHWKLGTQYKRRESRRSLNNDAIVQEITSTAFSIKHSNDEYDAELKINVLSSLRGVLIPVASAILALTYPDSYCVIDFRIMDLFFNERPVNFKSYYNYLGCVREVSPQFGLSPLKLDVALWQYHIENS